MKRSLVNSKTEELLGKAGYCGPSDFWSVLDWLRTNKTVDITVWPWIPGESDEIKTKGYTYEIIANDYKCDGDYFSDGNLRFDDFYDTYDKAIQHALHYIIGDIDMIYEKI